MRCGAVRCVRCGSLTLWFSLTLDLALLELRDHLLKPSAFSGIVVTSARAVTAIQKAATQFLSPVRLLLRLFPLTLGLARL